MELKQGSGYLYFDGDVQYNTLKTEYTTHDGKIYSSREFVQINTNCKNLLNEHKDWITYIDINFEELQYSVKIQDLKYFTDGISSLMPIIYSENYYVNLTLLAFNSGFLDKRILNVSTCKMDYLDRYDYPNQDRENFKRVLDNLSIDIFLKRYGFNNALFYTISLETLFLMPYERIPKYIDSFFKRNGVSLKSKNKDLQVINLLNKKITHETSKQ